VNVTLPVDDIVSAVRGRKVGLLTNGCVWLEQVGDDLAGLLRGHLRHRGDTPREGRADPASNPCQARSEVINS